MPPAPSLPETRFVLLLLFFFLFTIVGNVVLHHVCIIINLSILAYIYIYIYGCVIIGGGEGGSDAVCPLIDFPSFSLQTDLDRLLAEMHLTVSYNHSLMNLINIIVYYTYTFPSALTLLLACQPVRAETMPEPTWLEQLKETAVSSLASI